jgi:hypothetical protein
MQSLSELRSSFLKSLKLEKKKFPQRIGWRIIHQMSVSGNIEQWAKELQALDTQGRGRDKRRSMRARYIGLLNEDMEVTEPGKEFYKAVLKNSPIDTKTVLNKQFEKEYFPVAEYEYTKQDYDNYVNLGYGIYPCFFILRVLFYVGERDPDTMPHHSLSLEEFRLFCITAKSHDDYEDRGRLILDFRKNPSDYRELRSVVGGETYIERIIQEVELSSYVAVKDGRIILVAPESARESLLKFEYLLYTGNLIRYEENSRPYFDLLYDSRTLDEFHAFVKKLDLGVDLILSRYIEGYFKSQGFIYDEVMVRSFYASLKAKPFVIVTGLSGTGKTKLCELFAQASCEEPTSQFIRIPVRPDWNDDRFMLGFFNPLTERYHYEPFLDFVIKALCGPERPFFVCLDEMNLAHVEYYFSAFLSGLESLDKMIPLHSFPSASEVDQLKADEVKELCDRLKIEGPSENEKREKLKSICSGLPPSQLRIPPNLFFTGTVNIDETTHLFSPKVLDRANVIEFMKVDIGKNVEPEANTLPIDEVFHGVFRNQFLSFPESDFKKWRTEHWHEIIEERLAIVHKILEKSTLHFGYRTREEILRFLYCARDLMTLQDALDMQIKQRILPKIKGPATIRDTMSELKQKLTDWNYTRSLEKLNEMIEKLEQGFTSYF